MDDSGRLRWNRVENLIEESSKTLDQDPAQLWLIASWVLGDTGSSIRGPFVDEIARLMDAAVAGSLLCFTTFTVQYISTPLERYIIP